jgi:hypothetical protein
MQQNRVFHQKTPLAGRFLLVTVLAALGSAALLVSWLMPNHYPPWTSFHGEAAAFAALCSLCVARALRQDATAIGVAPFICALLCILIGAQWAFGQIAYGGDALLSILYLSGFALAWWLGANSVDSSGQRDPLSWLAILIVAGAAVSVFIAILQWLGIESDLGIFAADRGPNMRPFGNLAQPNHLATLCLMATVLSLPLLDAGWIKRWQWAALLAWFTLGLAMTESRSGQLGALVIGILLLAKSGSSAKLNLRKVVPAWWAMLSFAVWIWPVVNDMLYLRAQRVGGWAQDSDRIIMWRQSSFAIMQSPWIGYGWRQSLVGQKLGAVAIPGRLAPDYAHSIVLDLALWVGIPLAAALVVGGFAWLVRVFWRAKGAPQLYAFAAVAPVAVHSLFEFPFAYSYFLFPTVWLLGLLSSMQDVRDRSEARAKCGQWVTRAALVFTLVFSAVCAAVAVEYAKAEEDYRVMRFELRRLGRTPSDYETPHLTLLTQLEAMLTLGRLRPYPGMPERDLERLRLGSSSFGWATLDLSYAVALALNGRPEEAAHQLGMMRAVYGPDTYRSLVSIFQQLRSQYPQLRLVALPSD